MRVFVLGTGRCGTTAFAKACEHATNYTSGHETRRYLLLDYPNDHIEVDCRLVWYYPRLVRSYPDASFWYLSRERESCVRSIRERTRIVWDWSSMVNLPACGQASEDYYDFVEDYLFRLARTRRMYIEEMEQHFPPFWSAIGAEGDLDAALLEFGKRHNRGVTPAHA